MFAEELSGNSSKKRQDEARARRRQLKQQQTQQKQQQLRPQPAVTLPVAAFTSNLSSNVSHPLLIPPAAQTEITVVDSDPSSLKSSAVQNALQQRQLRQKSQMEIKSVVRIQAFYRAHRSNSALLESQAQLLSMRLKDLIVLNGLLKQKTNDEYVPPPATASLLVLQLLFLNRTLPYKGPRSVVIRSHDDVTRIQQVLQYVVLPGVRGADANLDPILPWPPTRLMELMRLALVASVRPGVTDSTLSVIDAFFRTLIGTEKGMARQSVVEEARHHLFPVTPLQYAAQGQGDSEASKNSRKKPYPHERVGSTLDLLLILRHHLLFSKGDPIPENSTRLRETFFTAEEKRQTDILFLLAVDGIISARFEPFRLHSRFLAEILTAPLLTWRTSIKSTTKLLSGSPIPNFLAMLSSVTTQHAATLSAGKIGTLLPTVDVPLTACPATASQCLLANLVQVGRACPLINGCARTNYDLAALFFNFLAMLLDIVPLGTLSRARESAVEWMSDGKSHLTAVVLSPVILEQCKYLLHDSFVRDLFTCAIDDDAMGTERTLSEKTEKDLKLEKDLFGSVTASSLAAKEARIDRSKGFWNSSKWAKNIKKSVSKILAGDNAERESKSSGKKGVGVLVNTSTTSRKLAAGPKETSTTSTNDYIPSDPPSKLLPFDPVMYFALCRAYSIVLARWGGGGRDDIVGRRITEEALQYRESKDKHHVATLTADPCTVSLLNVLSFSTPIVRTAWSQIQSQPGVANGIYKIIDPSKGCVGHR
jgi:hypothetical protein